MFKKLHVGIICQEFVRQANYGRYLTFFQSSLFFLNYSFYPYQQYGRKKTGDLSRRLNLANPIWGRRESLRSCKCNWRGQNFSIHL